MAMTYISVIMTVFTSLFIYVFVISAVYLSVLYRYLPDRGDGYDFCQCDHDIAYVFLLFLKYIFLCYIGTYLTVVMPMTSVSVSTTVYTIVCLLICLLFLMYIFLCYIGIYLTVVMAMTSVSVIMTVFVLNLHYRGPNDSPVPRWLRRLFLRNQVNKGLCFNRDSHYVDAYLSDSQSHYVKNVSLRLTIENLAQELKEELESCSGEFRPSSLGGDIEGDSDDAGRVRLAHRSEHFSRAIRQTNNRTNDEILFALRKVIERYEKDDSQEQVMYEWRQVALAVDRILFWIFFLGTLSSTVIVLIVAPITRMI